MIPRFFVLFVAVFSLFMAAVSLYVTKESYVNGSTPGVIIGAVLTLLNAYFVVDNLVLLTTKSVWKRK